TWQVALLDAVGLGDSMTHYPQAAVMSAGDADPARQDSWLLATPMHFAAGLNDLRAVLLDDGHDVTALERTELTATLAPHLLAAGFDVRPASSGPWLLRSRQTLEVATVTPTAAAVHGLGGLMPTGRDAAALKRLMTELQMLLHEHPVNLARARRGAPEINAIWLHGAGAIRDVARRPLPEAFGEDAYLRGLYCLHDQALVGPATDADSVLARLQANAVAVPDVSTLDELEAKWLTPLVRALRAGALAKLSLVLDGWRLSIDRGALLKFWRGASSPTQWSAQ
ncbi:MAG: hypothetical protein ACREV5_04215, partial [Steroidobacter sp.]